jgi:hypothetical protein
MTHREFLLWLSPRLESAVAEGLGRDQLRAIRDELKRMRKAGPLQPFASRLFGLVREMSVLDPATVKELAGEVRSELAPPREQTVVFSALGSDDK